MSPTVAELSPAAQAVLDAMYQVNMDFGKENAQLAAAALEAMADQVVPHEQASNLMRGPDLERLAQRQHTRGQLLAIAAELRGTDTP
jgi:hypothetical protein